MCIYVYICAFVRMCVYMCVSVCVCKRAFCYPASLRLC